MVAKWKELPTDVAELRNLYDRLKDKEMKLEADLAITENPNVEEAITRVALSLAEVKKLDEQIQKTDKLADPVARRQMDALVNRANHLRRQLEVAEAQISKLGGKTAEKLSGLRMNRDRSFAQLNSVFRHASVTLNQFDLQLEQIIPSIADFITVEPRQN